MGEGTPSTQPIIRQPHICANCGGQFFDRHSCPHMPWNPTAPRLVYEAGGVYVIKGFA